MPFAWKGQGRFLTKRESSRVSRKNDASDERSTRRTVAGLSSFLVLSSHKMLGAGEFATRIVVVASPRRGPPWNIDVSGSNGASQVTPNSRHADTAPQLDSRSQRALAGCHSLPSRQNSGCRLHLWRLAGISAPARQTLPDLKYQELLPHRC